MGCVRLGAAGGVIQRGTRLSAVGDAALGWGRRASCTPLARILKKPGTISTLPASASRPASASYGLQPPRGLAVPPDARSGSDLCRSSRGDHMGWKVGRIQAGPALSTANRPGLRRRLTPPQRATASATSGPRRSPPAAPRTARSGSRARAGEAQSGPHGPHPR